MKENRYKIESPETNKKKIAPAVPKNRRQKAWRNNRVHEKEANEMNRHETETSTKTCEKKEEHFKVGRKTCERKEQHMRSQADEKRARKFLTENEILKI